MSDAGGALRLVMGDQLSGAIAALDGIDPRRDIVLMAEVMGEARRWAHHKQKLALIYSAMRQFAAALRARGITVRYFALEDADNPQSLAGAALAVLGTGSFSRVICTEPSAFSILAVFEDLAQMAPVPVEVRPDKRFICSRADFEAFAKDRPGLRMETFYRWMRRRTGLLMEGGEPAGGRWNFDKENRKRPPKGLLPPPREPSPPNAVTVEVMAMVERCFPDNFGRLEGFSWPTNSQEAERVLDAFIGERLSAFGDWQDAMLTGQPWMWHAHVAAAMNIGLIDPLDACRRAEAAWRAGAAPLNAVEGFVRQILGWREFVRGLYWLHGPAYKALNALGADRRLPWAFWSGETDMRCLSEVVGQVRDHAYAHHIQRLMVTGNLALLLGADPAEVNDWYMVVFADAHEWVELPNTHGMAIFADGGIVGSKPYAASGAYIDRMSDYCRRCAYDVKDRLGERACPFNALYWDFLMRHEGRLRTNPRIGPIYGNVDRMGEAERGAIRAKAESVRVALGAVKA